MKAQEGKRWEKGGGGERTKGKELGTRYFQIFSHTFSNKPVSYLITLRFFFFNMSFLFGWLICIFSVFIGLFYFI